MYIYIYIYIDIYRYTYIYILCGFWPKLPAKNGLNKKMLARYTIRGATQLFFIKDLRTWFCAHF